MTRKEEIAQEFVSETIENAKVLCNPTEEN